MPTSFPEILLGYEFLEIGNGMHQAILCRTTGKIYMHAEFSDLEELNDVLPDDVEDDEEYIAIPTSKTLVSASRWCWILPVNFCPRTSMKSDTSSASVGPTGSFAPC